MHYCERCGSSYTATVAKAAGNCPSCREEGLDLELRFRLFEPSALKVAGISPHAAASKSPQADASKSPQADASR